MSFRIEEKFRLTNTEAQTLKTDLLAKGMTRLFPDRLIESLYFDNPGLAMFRDSEEGVIPRKKIRVRRYPRNGSSSSLEIKTSSIEGRFKVTKPLDADQFSDLIRNGIVDRLYGICKSVAYVRYEREYFSFMGTRINFDLNITYQDYRSQLQKSDSECVVEIKSSNDTPLDYLKSVIWFQRSRFSKYSRACEKVVLNPTSVGSGTGIPTHV